jgi:DNA invertase Pin-like site-specific DNA recombinase
MTPLQAAIYARVSSENQVEAKTIESQLAALRERIVCDGLRDCVQRPQVWVCAKRLNMMRIMAR